MSKIQLKDSDDFEFGDETIGSPSSMPQWFPVSDHLNGGGCGYGNADVTSLNYMPKVSDENNSTVALENKLQDLFDNASKKIQDGGKKRGRTAKKTINVMESSLEQKKKKSKKSSKKRSSKKLKRKVSKKSSKKISKKSSKKSSKKRSRKTSKKSSKKMERGKRKKCSKKSSKKGSKKSSKKSSKKRSRKTSKKSSKKIEGGKKKSSKKMNREEGDAPVEKKKRKPNPAFAAASAAFRQLLDYVLKKVSVSRKEAMKIAGKVNKSVKEKFPTLSPDERAKKAMELFDKNQDLYK